MATNNAINTPVITTTNHGIMVGQGSAATTTKVLTDGQLLIGSTGNDPVAAGLTAGAGITITPASGSITVASNGSQPWVDQTTTTVTMAVNTNYVADNAGLVTLTVPATAAIGDTFTIVGKGAGGWLVQMNTGQTAHLGSSVTASAGSLASTNQWDALTLTCVTANTVFAVRGVQGNITVA